mgnify:CR=1 FL=1
MQGQKQKMVTIDWKPNRESKEPIYAQIVDGFREQITGGVLPVKVLFVSDDGMQEVAL